MEGPVVEENLRGTLQQFRPYRAYIDSGVEWLGDIPAHWPVSRIGELTSLVNGFPFESEYFVRGEGIPLVRIRDLDHAETEVNYIGPVIEDAWIEPGDVIIGMDGEFNVARWRGQRALLNQRMCCLRPRSGSVAGFISYMLPLPLKVINDLTYSTTVKHLLSIDVRKIRIGTPPELEQQAIASFLDREMARIDALAAKKEQLIALLQEKRTALVTRAVTKGLDPNASMKDSGVDWLGKIPAHWQLKRVKNLSSFVTSGSRGWAEHYTDEGPLFLRIGNLKAGKIDLDFSAVQHVSPRQGVEGERTRVYGGDLVISITALIGAVGVIPEGVPAAFVNQHLALVRLSKRQINPRWLAYCVLSRVGQEQFRAELYGGTKDGLSLNDIRSLLVLEPPKKEQQRIVEILDGQGKHVDRLIGKVQEAIDRLKELRAALISAAVTGKIDVREEAV
jgi:type I restriction enzyme S subunit